MLYKPNIGLIISVSYQFAVVREKGTEDHHINDDFFPLSYAVSYIIHDVHSVTR